MGAYATAPNKQLTCSTYCEPAAMFECTQYALLCPAVAAVDSYVNLYVNS